MSDLIDRQAAIDAINHICPVDTEYDCTLLDRVDVRCVLSDLPSAQPEKHTQERTETHACDCISRQAAIDAIVAQTIGYTVDEIKAECEENIFNENGYLGGLKDAIEAIEDMQSAQPETHEERTETHACDYINRKDAIDAHYEYCNKHSDASFPVWSLKILEDLPSAQQDLSGYSDRLWKAAYERGKAEAQQRWIPCSERLPEERQEILATTTDNAWGDVVIIRTYYKEMHKSVIAWMPLPEPYRGEGEK